MQKLFTQFDERWKKHIDGYIEEKSGIKAVLAAADALRDFLKVESKYMRAMYTLWYESLSHKSEIRNSLAGHHDVYRKDATRWIEDGIASGEIDPKINPKQFAVQYCAFIFGLVYQWLVNAEALDLDAIFDDYEASIIKLLSNK
jgi:hypothetical protein